MVVERQRVSYQPPKSMSDVRLLREDAAEYARTGGKKAGCSAFVRARRPSICNVGGRRGVCLQGGGSTVKHKKCFLLQTDLSRLGNQTVCSSSGLTTVSSTSRDAAAPPPTELADADVDDALATLGRRACRAASFVALFVARRACPNRAALGRVVQL